MLSAAVEKSARWMGKSTGDSDHAGMLIAAPLFLAVNIDNYAAFALSKARKHARRVRVRGAGMCVYGEGARPCGPQQSAR